ncbi:MAG: 5'/3'-nucleotidase SurE, partial [Pseudomonadota bacterium]
MRILITNDDGIHAPGLAVLETLAHEIVGTEGEVWTVAPLTEKSGVGHCISYTSPIRYQREQGDRRFAVDGTPADCVLAGLHHFVQDPVDLVL